VQRVRSGAGAGGGPATAQPGVRGLVQTDHRRLRFVPAREKDPLRLGYQRSQRRLRHRRGVRIRIPEDLLDIGVAGDHVAT
jgi:hypothetical protein